MAQTCCRQSESVWCTLLFHFLLVPICCIKFLPISSMVSDPVINQINMILKVESARCEPSFGAPRDPEREGLTPDREGKRLGRTPQRKGGVSPKESEGKPLLSRVRTLWGPGKLHQRAGVKAPLLREKQFDHFWVGWGTFIFQNEKQIFRQKN